MRRDTGVSTQTGLTRVTKIYIRWILTFRKRQRSLPTEKLKGLPEVLKNEAVSVHGIFKDITKLSEK